MEKDSLQELQQQQISVLITAESEYRGVRLPATYHRRFARRVRSLLLEEKQEDWLDIKIQGNIEYCWMGLIR